ncbi:MAG TPA: Clp protease N-terminal domain-containing protein, partial [Bacteroidales bacterium]|nr:Clp protease N-terminal domain-containing protein [Bacteroidales bacterium]
MQLDKFTIKAQEAVQHAQQLAMENQNQAIECGHLLKGLFDVDENVLPFIFKKLAVNPQAVEKAVDSIIAGYPKVSGGEQYLS